MGLASLLWPRTPRSRANIPSGRVVLDYWEKWTGSEGLALQKIVDRYNLSQDRVWIRRIPVADIVPKTLVAIAGGDPPDLAGLYSFNIPQLAESRACMSFDELADTHEPVTPDLYAPAVSRLLTFNGLQWAAVTSCYALGLYCNLAHLRELDLDAAALPRTISQLDELAERLTIRGADAAWLAGLDLNLAPLEADNPFSLSKSEIKWLEAALVSVPTIASRTPAFEFAIRPGENGWLAGNPAEWTAALEQAFDEQQAGACAARAFADARDKYRCEVRALQLLQTLHSLSQSLGVNLDLPTPPGEFNPAALSAAAIPPEMEKFPSRFHEGLYNLSTRGAWTLARQVWAFARREIRRRIR